MKGKIAGWIFLLAALTETIVNIPKILELFKMVDKTIFLEIAFFIIMVASGIIYLAEKYKRLTNWIGRFEFKHDKGSYLDLKGKIKFYIREELEKLQLQKTVSENKPITIRAIGDQVSQSIEGGILIQKWGIEPHVLLSLVENIQIIAHTPGERADIIANNNKNDLEETLGFCQEKNETDEDTVLRFIFKPQDIRDFERKVAMGQLSGYVLKNKKT